MSKETYKDLQKQAKALGLKYVGVSEIELADMIAKAKGVGSNTPATEEVEVKESDAKFDAKEETPKVKYSGEVSEYNAVSIVEGKKEIRRYTLEEHGEDFRTLAEAFAEKNGYGVVLKNEKPAILCPHCGGKIYQSK